MSNLFLFSIKYEKMRKYSFCLIFVNILFLPLLLIGQVAEETPAALTWGNEMKEPSNTFLSEILGTDGKGFYALREKVVTATTGEHPQKIFLEYYNKDMKLKKAKEIDLRYKKKKRELEKVLYWNSELYLLTSFNNQAHKANYLFMQPIKKTSFNLSSKLKKISETPARDKYREGKFDFHISKDSSKLLIYSQLPYKKKEPERFALQVFDDQFEKVWEKNIKLPYPDNQFAVEEYRVDEEGNVYLLGVYYQDNSGFRRKGKPTYKYIVLAYTNDGDDVEEYQVDLKEKFITDLTFRIGNDGKIVCSGFYSERGNYSIKGTYFFQLDPKSGKVSNQNLKEFDFDFVTEYYSDNQKRKAKKAALENNDRRAAELSQYSLNELILRSDGGAVLIAEQYYIQRVQNNNYYDYWGRYNYYNRNRFDEEYLYHYNDIIVVNIRPNGEIQWSARIPKRQETRNDGGYYSSYAMAVVRDKMYFVFNDNGKNFSKQKQGKRFRFNGSQSIIALAEINKNGSVKTYPLASNRDEGIITRPKVCRQIGKREMVIFGERGKRFKFAELEF